MKTTGVYRANMGSLQSPRVSTCPETRHALSAIHSEHAARLANCCSKVLPAGYVDPVHAPLTALGSPVHVENSALARTQNKCARARERNRACQRAGIYTKSLALPTGNQLLLELFCIAACLEILETAQVINDIAHLAKIDFLDDQGQHTYLKLVADLTFHILDNPTEIDNVTRSIRDFHSFFRLGQKNTYLARKTAAQVHIALRV